MINNYEDFIKNLPFFTFKDVKDLNPEDQVFNNATPKIIEGTAIECSNSGFRMPEDKQLT